MLLQYAHAVVSRFLRQALAPRHAYFSYTWQAAAGCHVTRHAATLMPLLPCLLLLALTAPMRYAADAVLRALCREARCYG